MKLDLNVCMGKSQCRYLGEENGEHTCHKLIPEDRQHINEEVKQAMSCDFNYVKLPLGDNCPGVTNKQSWWGWLFGE